MVYHYAVPGETDAEAGAAAEAGQISPALRHLDIDFDGVRLGSRLVLYDIFNGVRAPVSNGIRVRPVFGCS